MKYEMIFGDQSLFDKATRKNTVAIYKISENLTVEFDKYEELLAFLQQQPLCDRPDIAMRRIIPEPKRWTWEDQRAGRLPEVGCRAIWHDDNGMKYTVKIETAFFGNECAVSIDDEAIYFAEKFCLFPIETPAEKAQREEDEFVSGIVFEYDKMPSSVLFEAGIRAAYRKLKGGE